MVKKRVFMNTPHSAKLRGELGVFSILWMRKLGGISVLISLYTPEISKNDRKSEISDEKFITVFPSILKDSKTWEIQ